MHNHNPTTFHVQPMQNPSAIHAQPKFAPQAHNRVNQEMQALCRGIFPELLTEDFCIQQNIPKALHLPMGVSGRAGRQGPKNVPNTIPTQSQNGSNAIQNNPNTIPKRSQDNPQNYPKTISK